MPDVRKANFVILVKMNLEILGRQIKTKRKELGISLNKMSNDLYGNRGFVNYLSKIEKGKIDIQFTTLVLIFGYLNMSFWGIENAKTL